jgi:hypothetical protein
MRTGWLHLPHLPLSSPFAPSVVRAPSSVVRLPYRDRRHAEPRRAVALERGDHEGDFRKYNGEAIRQVCRGFALLSRRRDLLDRR